MDLILNYLHEMRLTRATGSNTVETSFYGPLERLLNEVGKTLKPRVRAVAQLSNRGTGQPDFGLYSADQFQRAAAGAPLRGQQPSRGVVEAKGTGADVLRVAQDEQVRRYLRGFGQVLVTNYRDFLLVVLDANGNAVQLEQYQLAPDEAAFWTDDPARLAETRGPGLIEYLRRVLLHAARLSNPADVAWFLASYARDARARVEQADARALEPTRLALEQGLGIAFQGERGLHFFRSTLIQTLFYGIFSAWVLWHDERPERTDSFDWRTAEYNLRVPIIQALFEQVSRASQLRAMNLMQVLEWTGAALNRVDRAAFFQRFEQGLAVQYFYEPFLEAFDPELRRELGVWYTPPEIVRYMVERVDQALRHELGIADGLADPNVYVLDPCCGTGAYLVEVLRRIAQTLREQGDDALLASDLKRAATGRIFGFELLPAPFVVAHLQIGLLLQTVGAPLAEAVGSGQHERAAIYLTNALTGWEPPSGPQQQLLLPELAQERDAAGLVKRDQRIVVILGNPPYNGFAGLAMHEERVLASAYRNVRRVAPPQGQGLNDLYVRFFRMAERHITEQAGRGIVCFISNYSWLDGLSYTGMRERYLDAFDSITIDSLNGDKYRTGKVTPDGHPDPSVFSTDFNPEGIQVGTAIALLVRRARHTGAEQVQFRNLWGRTKRAQLDTPQADTPAYQPLEPALGLGLPFMPTLVEAAYLTWPLLPHLFPVAFPGVKTSRDDVVVDIDRERLVQRMEHYFDPRISHAEMRRIAPGAMESTPTFNAETARDYLVRRGFLPDNIIRYCYRPFDTRWLYWEPETKLLDRNRAEYRPHVFEGNIWIEARQKQPMERFDRGYVVHVLADNFGNGLSNYFPLYLKLTSQQSTLFEEDQEQQATPNVSAAAMQYLAGLGVDERELFYHTIAVLHAPAYRAENAGGLRQDWPRVPLPAQREVLLASAALGRQVAALLDTETPVVGVTTGTVPPELRLIGQVTHVHGWPINPDQGDLSIRAGWGSGGNGRIVMPGKGRLSERAYSQPELAALARPGAPDPAPLGITTYDVYLNQVAYWRNVPARVWDYTIGGYQVIKKWLSYREQAVLGRALTPDEAREVTQMTRRIASILLLEPALDRSYAAVKQATVSLGGA